MSHINKSRINKSFVSSHQIMSHIDETCHIRTSHATYEWAISRVHASILNSLTYDDIYDIYRLWYLPPSLRIGISHGRSAFCWRRLSHTCPLTPPPPHTHKHVHRANHYATHSPRWTTNIPIIPICIKRALDIYIYQTNKLFRVCMCVCVCVCVFVSLSLSLSLSLSPSPSFYTHIYSALDK